MGQIRTVFWRELKAYFDTALGPIVHCSFLLTFGFLFFFVYDVFSTGVASMRGMFGLAPLLLAVLCPIVTMRLLAEERTAGTLELLLTLPLREWDIVTGKFLAAVALVATAFALTLPFPLCLLALGDLDLGPVLGGYLGMLWMAAAYLSLGLFCSCLWGSQILAALSALMLCLSFWISDKVAALLPPGPLPDLLRFLGFEPHFLDIQRGVLDSRDLLYFATVITFFLCFSVQVLKRRRLQA